jgi:hypothetical protein
MIVAEPLFIEATAGTLSKYGAHSISGPGAVDFFSTRKHVVSRWIAPIMRQGCASPTRSVCSPHRQSVSNSPISVRKGMLPSLHTDPMMPPMIRRNSSVSSGGSTTVISAFGASRENSGTTDISCDTDGDHSADSHSDQQHSLSSTKIPAFHGIAATSPFASADPHFDFDVERVKNREDSFNPCLSVQPSFEGDPRATFPLERGPSDISMISAASSELSLSGAVQTSGSKKHYNIDLYAVEELDPAQTEAVESLVTSIGPLEGQYKYRASAVRFLKKQLRKALQCNVFETNFLALRAFLPTDPFKLSVVLIGRLEPCWQVLVRDGLLKVANAGHVAEPDAGGQAAEGKHVIKRVEVVKVGATGEYRVHCLCDVTEVEISLNARNDICMLAFFEEVDQLVGHDSLFKRSVLLIRAWWEYDTAECFESPLTKQVLTESTICVMVCAIFNQYHARINNPLQALCLFLAEYSAYDGATQAITLQGIVPFRAADSHQLHAIDSSKKHLISQSLLEKYWQVFHVDDVVKAKSPAMHGLTPPLLPTDPSLPFVREAFNVLHPFEGTNMVRGGKTPERRPARLAKAFADGARTLSLALSRSKSASAASTPLSAHSQVDAPNTSAAAPTATELIDIFFPISKARFGHVTRPDAFVGAAESPSSRGAA